MMSGLLVPVAAGAAFLISGAWYGTLGSRLAALSPAYAGPNRPAAATAAVELARNLALALAILVLVDGRSAGGALLLALLLWVAFPVVLLAGSVFHERVPPQLAAIHAGDWLLKLLAVTAVLSI